MTAVSLVKTVWYFFIVLVIGLCIVGSVVALKNQSAVQVFILQEFKGASNFEIGQYYFNHDGSAGVYDLAKARTYYEKSISESPVGHNMAWYQLGRIDFIEGKFDDALNAFDNQVRYFDADIPQVYYMIGLTYGYRARKNNSTEDWLQAEDNFSRYITYVQTAPWPRVDLAWVYFAQGKFEEMLPVLEPILTVHANNPWVLNMYGLAIMNTTDDKTTALPYFYQAREEAEQLQVADWGAVYPGNNPAHWSLGLQEFNDLIKKNIALLE
jgi:tetratricopeptide (TPR) repeat protein